VFLPGDVGVLRSLRALGADGVLGAAERWRPWRSYATHHLWAALESGADQ
jgi:AraC family transcriptional regulator of adaptative response / DNA-3-methyladenine glycosylase II